MATFASLIGKQLIPVILRLPRGQFHERKIYAYPDCVRWMRDDVPKMTTGRLQSDFTPHEQMVERLRQWVSGDPMEYGRMFHDMEPSTDDVWEMKTADLRIFGWLYRKRNFIAVKGGFADHFKAPTKIKSYADERRNVVRERAVLPLDEPKHIAGSFDELV